MAYPKIAAFADAAAFRSRLAELALDLPCDDAVLKAPGSPLAQPVRAGDRTVGNRFCIQPMEGWDGTEDGHPTEFTIRRWRRFGTSGAKLIWGGEAVAVLPEARANPNQLLLNPGTVDAIAALRRELVAAHEERFGGSSDLYVGLQLTHSGRFCRPFDRKRMEPRTVYRHPVLDTRFGISDPASVLSDAEIGRIVEAYGLAAGLAWEAGFEFVDLKHCHGYLGHEFLSARSRPGRYGGSLENRARFLREATAAIRAAAPEMQVAVRLSAFDMPPFHPDPSLSSPGKPGPGIAELPPAAVPYTTGFGLDPERPERVDLSETFEFVAILQSLGIAMLNVTAGSPYYNPHIQRPAIYPPSDGYQPPEDPLVGVARQVSATAAIKERFPEMLVVGSAYSYLQEFLPHVAQAVVRAGMADFVGLGRMTLSYPDLPADVLEGGVLNTKLICRTFSDCTTAPRNGLVSGCFPLDPFYKDSPIRLQLQAIKRGETP